MGRAAPWAVARPLAVRAASFARRVVSKPGQAPPPPAGTAAAPNQRLRAPQPRLTSAHGHRSQASQPSGALRIGTATKQAPFGLMCSGSALLGEALHPIRRHCTRSDRVQRYVTGAVPRNGCSATQRVRRHATGVALRDGCGVLCADVCRCGPVLLAARRECSDASRVQCFWRCGSLRLLCGLGFGCALYRGLCAESGPSWCRVS